MRKQFYLHNFLASQPDLNFHNPEVQDALLTTVRFWLDRGVDGFRLDTVNFYVHDKKLRDNPPRKLSRKQREIETNPYEYQDHLYDKTRPENIAFLKRFRALLDSFDDRACVGEVGDSQRGLKTVAAYTSGRTCCTCATRSICSARNSPPRMSGSRSPISRRRSPAAGSAGPSPTTTCSATSRAGRGRAARPTTSRASPSRCSPACAARSASTRARNSASKRPTSPSRICAILWNPLLAGFKGRDGCRTPMPWQSDAHAAGFTTGKPWLPIPQNHRERAVDRQQGQAGSVMELYRQVIAFRRQQSPLVSGTDFAARRRWRRAAFLREAGNETLLCVFNFSDTDSAAFSTKQIGRTEAIGFPAPTASRKAKR